MESSEVPNNHEANEISELLLEERRAVLALANKLHASAHSLRGRTAGDVFERYLVINDYDIPFPAEKIRVAPRNTRVAEITEAFLYFPIDADFRDTYEDHTIPNTFFFNLRYRNGTVSQGIFLERSIWMFEENDDMVVDTSLLPASGEEKLDITTIFSSGSELRGEDEYKLIQDFKLILGSRSLYRLGKLQDTDSE